MWNDRLADIANYIHPTNHPLSTTKFGILKIILSLTVAEVEQEINYSCEAQNMFQKLEIINLIEAKTTVPCSSFVHLVASILSFEG
jgi:hypothetical protein